MLEAVGGFSIKSQLSCILQLAKVLHFSAQLGSACFPGYIAYFFVCLCKADWLQDSVLSNTRYLSRIMYFCFLYVNWDFIFIWGFYCKYCCSLTATQSVIFVFFFISHVLFHGNIQRFAGNGNLVYSCVVSKNVIPWQGGKRIRFLFFFLHLHFCVIL